MLKDKGYSFTTPADIEVVRDIKEKLCYIVEKNFDQELKKSQDNTNNDKTYDLPDGRTIVVGHERFMCPEILFQPNRAQFELEGIHKYAYDSVMKCDADVRKDLF